MEESAGHEQAKDLAELKKQHAVLEERMKTLQSDLQGTLERFRADMARRDADMARRDKDNLRWQIGLWVAAVVILGVIIRWPSVPGITG